MVQSARYKTMKWPTRDRRREKKRKQNNESVDCEQTMSSDSKGVNVRDMGQQLLRA